MRGRLFEAAKARRDLIRSFIEKIRREEKPVTTVKIYDLDPQAGPGGGLPHAAEDGGSRLEEFEAYTLFIARGWAASYTNRGAGGSYGVGLEVEYSDVGLVLPPAYGEERVRVYRETLEAIAAGDVLAEVEGGVLLWDGSLRPLVARHRPGAADKEMAKAVGELRSRLRMDLGEALEEIARMWGGGEAPAAPSLVASRLSIEDLADEDATWIALLEWSEKLLAVRRLLQEAWRRGVTPVFVTKTSRSTSLFRRVLPDVYYLKRLRRFDPFRTEHTVLKGLEELRGVRRGHLRGPLVPEELGLDEFYRERLGLAEFYLRLDPGAPILKVEVAFDAGSTGDPRGMVERAIRALRGLPRARGYPMSLIVAHQRARLDRGDVERVISILGLELERRGRWVL